MYNGQRDGSACNHMGNSLILDKINYSGSDLLKKTGQKLLKTSSGDVIG